MTRGCRGMRALAVALGAAALMSACAVTTPRDGVVLSQAGGGLSQAGGVPLSGEVAADGAPLSGGTSTTLPDGTPVGAVPGGEGAQPVAQGANQGAAGGSGVAAGAGGRSAGGGGTSSAPGSAGNGTAASGKGAPGVTDKTITIAAFAGFTGVIGPVVEGFYGGYETWRSDVNARGGINGREVVLKKVDHKDTAEGGVAACKKVVDDKDTFMAVILLGLNGSDVSAAGCLDAAGVPVVGISMSAYRDSWKHVHTLADNGDWSRGLPSYIKNKMGKGGTKIGLFVSRNSVATSMRKPVEAEMKRLGLGFVHTEVVADQQSNLVSEMTRMRNSGAETVILLLGTEVIAGLRDARAINYRPTWVGAGWDIDEFSSAGRDLMEGIEGLRPWSATNSQAYNAFKGKHQKYNGRVFTSTVAAVYGYGLFTEQVLRNAGASPTRGGLDTAIESVTNYNNGYQSLSFGKGVKRATTAAWPIKCCNSDNTWMGLGAPRSTF